MALALCLALGQAGASPFALLHGRGELGHPVQRRPLLGRLEDLSDLLCSVGKQDEAFPIHHGRGDGATHPAGADPRAQGHGIKVRTRDFR